MVAPRTRAEASGQLAQMEAINTDRPGTRFRPRGPGETSKARLALSLRGSLWGQGLRVLPTRDREGRGMRHPTLPPRWGWRHRVLAIDPPLATGGEELARLAGSNSSAPQASLGWVTGMGMADEARTGRAHAHADRELRVSDGPQHTFHMLRHHG